MSGVLTEEEPKDLSGLMILLINKLMTMSLVSNSGSGGPAPRRAFLMLRRLESQCTGGARESEEVKVKGGKWGEGG